MHKEKAVAYEIRLCQRFTAWAAHQARLFDEGAHGGAGEITILPNTQQRLNSILNSKF